MIFVAVIVVVIQEPIEIEIGETRYVHQFSGAKRRLVQRRSTYQYVPFLQSLRQLLLDSSVLEEVEHTSQRIHKNGMIEDFCDGSLFSKHPLFSTDPNALQIIGYYDELEVCNPLGPHTKKHKLGIVFYTLGNIRPCFRSQLKMINLVLAATVPVIEEHGLDSILKPFIADLNILATEGISVKVNGTSQIFKGALLAFLADNLASNDLGGFKKSFSFSFRCCRTCLVTKNSLSDSFLSNDYTSRTEHEHLKQVKLLEGPGATHFSKTYGINRKSAIMDIKYYSMFDGGLPHDAMHDVFEGVASSEIKFLLSYCIKQGFFTLNDYNDRLLNFNFGYSDNDKPVPILSTIIHAEDKPLKSTASQMMTLARILPFLVADKIPEGNENWKCFLILRRIIGIVLSPVASESLCTTLKFLIKEHHTLFIKLYGSSAYVMKFHMLIHYPEQILSTGPMTKTWTIRHEAKLSFFKRASSISNFKNIPLSLANRHQRWLCYEMASGKIVSASIECGPARDGHGISCFSDETKDIQVSIKKIVPGLSEETTLFRPTWVRKHHITYQINNAYVIIKSDGLDPVFGRIEDFFCVRWRYDHFCFVGVFNTLL